MKTLYIFTKHKNMSKYITRIRTTTGDSQIDYNALANQPLKMTTINLFATD